MRNASDNIVVDFGHRTATITVGDVQGWLPWTEDTVTMACKALRLKADNPGARRCAQDIVNDVAAQTPGCIQHECYSCGASTYGSDVGEDLCVECYELAGIDNQCNDEGRGPDASETAQIEALCMMIDAAGGDSARAMADCEYLTNTGENLMSNTTLKNGATVIDQRNDVVLAKWQDDQYVTWRVDADLNAYWGHYFDNIEDATADFAKRTGGAS